MRLLLAELRKVWGLRVTALCLAVLAGANLFLLYTGTKPGVNAAPASAWRAAGRDLRGLSTAEQQAFINEKLDTAKGVYQVGQLLYGYALNAQYGHASNPRTQYPELFEQYEQIYLEKNYTLYTENLRQEVPFLTTVKSELDTVAGYHEFLDDVQTKAQQLSGISIFQNSQSGYDLENIGKTAAVYADMGDVQINYSPQEGLYTALDYPFTDLILLAAMLLLASLLVRAERDNGMLSFVRTTPGGRLKTAAAKLGALSVSLLAVVILLYVVNLAYCQLTFGLGPLNRSIQSVPALMRCTMQITVAQYLGLFLLAKWAGAFVMGLWVMLAALICRRAAASWCIGLTLPAVQWIIRHAIPATSRLNVVKYANLASLLRTNELLGNYRNLFWFDHPVPLPMVEWSAAILWCAAFLAAFCLVFCRAALLPAPVFAGMRLGRPHTWPTTVFLQEARKLFLSCGALVILTIFTGYQAWQVTETKSFIDAEEIYYQYYMTHISGPYDQDAYQWLLEQNKEFAPIRQLEQALASGAITVDEYQFQMSAYYSLAQKKRVFDRVIHENLPYLKDHPGAQLVYESGWEELFCFSGANDLQDALAAGLLASICFAGFFAFEHRGGMKRVIMATPLGRRKTVRAKLLCAGGASGLIWVLTSLPHFIVILRDYGLPAPFAPAMSLSDYLHLPGWLPLAGVLALAGIARLAAVLCMAAVTLWLSETLGSALSAMFLSALVFCLPPMLALSGLWSLRWVGMYPLFHLAELLRRPGDGAASIIFLFLSVSVCWLCSYQTMEEWKTVE